MNKRRSAGPCRVWLASILWMVTLHAFNMQTMAQIRKDSLPEVQIVSTRYNVPAIEQPQQVIVINDAVLANTSARDLVSLLSLYGHAYLRSNGPGLASGLTQRGFGTTSYKVIRDGFTLNQHMHGQVDMALIPTAALGSVEMATANTSSTYGSAAAGGSLLLHQNWNTGWMLSHERGPWGYMETSASAAAPLGSASLTINGGFTQSDNSFAYESDEGDARTRRQNSHLDRIWLRLGALTNVLGVVARTNLHVHTADRGIPDPVNFLGSEGTQSDDEIRLATEVSRSQNHGWKLGAQVWQSRLLYDDNWLTERSYNRIRGASMAWNQEFNLVNWFHLGTSVGAEHTSIVTNNYAENPSRNALNASLRGLLTSFESTRIYPALRLDAIEQVGSALSPSLGINQPLLPGRVHVRSQWSYNFTAPTLNDQYWSYGGNRDLKPEKAHKWDVGLHLLHQAANVGVDWQVQYYLTRARNGIVWQPDASGSWSPVNLQEMHGRGMENSLNASASLGGFRFHAGSQLTWTRAYQPRPRYDGDPAVYKQLRYTPEWMLKTQAGASLRLINLSTEMAFVGKRFTSEAHQAAVDPLPAFKTVNFVAQFNLPAATAKPELRFTLVNAFNEEYSTIAWYPMPGRHLLVSLRLGRRFGE